MVGELPRVVRWDTFPLDVPDRLKRFKMSKANYFIKDQEQRITMGFWEAEEGAEVFGGRMNTVMMVIEGEFNVSAPGVPEQVAGAGDVVVGMRDSQTRVAVKERARGFFIGYGFDPEED